MTSAYQTYPNYTEPPKKKSRKGLLFFIIILVLALIGAGGYFYWQSQEKNKTAATPSASSQASATASTKASASSTTPSKPSGSQAPTSTGPANNTGPVTDGATRTGKIGTAEQRDSYDLDLGSATEFTIVDIAGDVDFKLVADGVSNGNGLPGPHQFGVAEQGTHTIEVSGTSGATGAYGFRLVTLKKRQINAKVGDKITGKLDVAGRVDQYIVDAGGAANIAIDGGTPCEDINLGFGDAADPRVLTPHLTCWDPKSEVDGGKIAIVIWSEGGKTGDYSFTIKSAE
jgi:hypothetical protein